jgi:eukaryotic-like serine/threonine-protein kinase
MTATPEQRWTKVTDLFEAALELSPDERDAFLEQACSGDEGLRGEVRSLLEADARAGDFMEVSAGDQETSDSGASVLSKGDAVGRYAVHARLGVGGMGVVYLADDPVLHRKVAIKLIRPGATLNSPTPRSRDRLMREAQAMAQLSHPNVIAVHDVGTFGDQIFVVMEYLEGSTLTQWLAERERPWREILDMFVPAGRGLAAAHAAGVLHRDFKPDNVLVGADGRPRVLDFGLARALRTGPEKRPSDDGQPQANGASRSVPFGMTGTEPDSLMGTPAYMAPEQLTGQGADHRTDQYSFCVALYEGLYGEPPFKGRTVEELLRETSRGEPPEAAASVRVPSRLRRAVLRGLRPEPADRYPSMDALLDELSRQASRTGRRIAAVAVLVLLGAIGAVGGIVRKERRELRPRIESIAILPLRNLGDPSDENLVDGLSLGLTRTVAELSRATVTSHDSAVRYKASPKSPQQIGQELSVDAIVTGSAKRSGASTQVDVQVTQAATGQQLWTRTFQHKSSDLPMLQADLAASLLAEVDSRRITPEQEARLASVRSVKPEVFEACLKGWLLERRRTTADLKKSIAYFQQAIRMDPDYAPAYVGLATSSMDLAISLSAPPREASRVATENLIKALSLDARLGEAHTALAQVKMMFDWDWRAAEEEVKRAIELSPNDARAHARYASYLLFMHRLDEALVEITRARRLDPLAPEAHQFTAWWFVEKNQLDRSIEELHTGMELEPNRLILHEMLADSYHDLGRYQEALAESQKAYEISESPLLRLQIAHMLVHLGKADQARKIVAELRDQARNTAASYKIAKTYAALERREEAIEWLELAYQARASDLLCMHLDHDFDFLNSDPRLQDLVKRIGLPR